ncbi:hypothetical protein B0H14DRAFT_3454045 [Mycena olivaceomarginata]|nr:hypothetical protein B0H14DRAFT_3454045 [Mycena olivaceomarginata]
MNASLIGALTIPEYYKKFGSDDDDDDSDSTDSPPWSSRKIPYPGINPGQQSHSDFPFHEEGACYRLCPEPFTAPQRDDRNPPFPAFPTTTRIEHLT